MCIDLATVRHRRMDKSEDRNTGCLELGHSSHVLTMCQFQGLAKCQSTLENPIDEMTLEQATSDDSLQKRQNLKES